MGSTCDMVEPAERSCGGRSAWLVVIHRSHGAARGVCVLHGLGLPLLFFPPLRFIARRNGDTAGAYLRPRLLRALTGGWHCPGGRGASPDAGHRVRPETALADCPISARAGTNVL